MEALVTDMDEAALIREDGKLAVLKVGAPLFHCNQNDQVFLVIRG